MFEDELMHYGIKRRSGRYPWGSGGNVPAHSEFLSAYADLRKQGLSQVEIARGLGIVDAKGNPSTTRLRALNSIAKNEQRAADAAQAYRLKQHGYANTEIGRIMGKNESVVRSLLDPSTKMKADSIRSTADMLKDQVTSKKYVDVGRGTENYLGISATKLNTAIAALQEEGYTVHYLRVNQLGTGNKTSVKVLAAPETSYSEVYKNQASVQPITARSSDRGYKWEVAKPPVSISSSRLAVKYGNEGGSDMDGAIEIRPGVPDLALGGAKYAQVRIAVDGTHYIKGVAQYSDNLPDGVDLRFNTNKKTTGNKLDALKKMKVDPETGKIDESNPFGASIHAQREYTTKSGQKKQSAMNVVYEEGEWGEWSKSLSSQMLSKQTTSVAKKQLGLAYDIKKEQFDEINSLTNPTVKRKLLESFADDCDSSAVHLKAAPFSRQGTHVIIPIPGMSTSEIYAPNYKNGESVVLVRFPHGGTFEIPELKVNNKNSAAKQILGAAKDAVGINARVAERLSGADFDGDTVLVIPNDRGSVRTSPALKGLENFDPKAAYPKYEGMKVISPKAKQQEMGNVSNLITDMTIKGAKQDEIAAAVRHSMVIIDAEKHELNYKQSYKDNRIAALKAKYQGKSESGSLKGASTLISRASSDIRVPLRRPARVNEGGPVDPKTGAKRYVETPESYVNKQGKTVHKTTKTKKMAVTDDAFTLSSGTPMEAVYATHANKLKALANASRKEALATKNNPQSKSAKTAYQKEVASLRDQLNTAKMNAPLERQAQLIANYTVKTKLQDNPDMESSEIKKVKAQALAAARVRTGAKKKRVTFTDREWEAVQAGAISGTMLESLLANADMDEVKKLATPRVNTVMTPAKLSRAKNLLGAGYTQAEVAAALGVPTSTLNSAL